MATDLDTDGPGTPIRHTRATNFNYIVHNNYYAVPHEILLFGAICPSYLFSGVGTSYVSSFDCVPLPYLSLLRNSLPQTFAAYLCTVCNGKLGRSLGIRLVTCSEVTINS